MIILIRFYIGRFVSFWVFVMLCWFLNRKVFGLRKNLLNFVIKIDKKSLLRERSDGKFVGVNVVEKFFLID